MKTVFGSVAIVGAMLAGAFLLFLLLRGSPTTMNGELYCEGFIRGVVVGALATSDGNLPLPPQTAFDEGVANCISAQEWDEPLPVADSPKASAGE